LALRSILHSIHRIPVPTAKANSIMKAKNRTRAMIGLRLMSARTDAIRLITAKTSHTTTNNRAIDINIHPKIEKGLVLS
jgi:hypothetical protein